MEQLQSGRGVPSVIFELRPLATKSDRMTVWFGVCADEGEKERYFFGIEN